MPLPRQRPPTGEFGEPLAETETNWWDLPIEGGGYTGSPSGRQGVWNDPNVRSGGLGSPRSGASEPPFMGAVRAAKPSGPSPRFQDFHLESIERGLKQAITLKGLREQLTGVKKKSVDPKILELESLRYDLEKARLQKEIKELRKRKPAKRTKPTPVWGI